MKVRAVIPQTITNPDLIVRDTSGAIDQAATALAVQLLRSEHADKTISDAVYLQRRYKAVPKGYEHEHPDAWMLVGSGWEPADDECHTRAEQAGLLKHMAANNLQALKLSRGQGTGQRSYDLSDAAADKLTDTRAKRVTATAE